MPLMPGAQDVGVDDEGRRLADVRGSARAAPTSCISPMAAAGSTGASARALHRQHPHRLLGRLQAGGDAGVPWRGPWPQPSPIGRVALTGARLVTMGGADGGIIEDGTILIDGDRIVAVGPRGSVAVPAGTPTVDVPARPSFRASSMRTPTGPRANTASCRSRTVRPRRTSRSARRRSTTRRTAPWKCSPRRRCSARA